MRQEVRNGPTADDPLVLCHLRKARKELDLDAPIREAPHRGRRDRLPRRKRFVDFDTSNYYPAWDKAIAEVDNGKPETLWSSEQVGRPPIKAWDATRANAE
jgi:hypothetical protein